MEDESLASLRLGIIGKPINIRALRRWSPRYGKYTTSYVFVDKFGAGIQAVVQGPQDQNSVLPRIELGNCYELAKYTCSEPTKFINALPHEVNMRIGRSTLITAIKDIPEMPHHYFNFGNYQKLIAICDNEDEVTDYCGMLQGRIADKIKKDGEPFLSFNLIDISNEKVQVTLWDEIITNETRFDRIAIENANPPVIIAVSSAKVTTYSEKPSLQSTSSTFVFVNPQIPETALLLNRLQAADFGQINQALQTCTISEIIEKQPRELQGAILLCHAKIQQITSTISWFRNVCPKCSYEIYPYGNRWMCTTDGEFDHAIYMYQLSAKIEDETGELNVTINHNSATTMIGIECSHLMITDACRSGHAIPAEITSLEGKSMIFHIQAYRERRSQKIKATVHQVTDMETQPPQKDDPTSSSRTHTPAPTTPQTSKTRYATSRRLEFTPESTPKEDSKRRKMNP